MRHLLCCVVLYSIRSMAQEGAVAVYHTPRTQYAFPEEADPSYVLREGSALRTAPHKDAGLVATLHSGERVFVEERHADILHVFGITSAWYRITAGTRTGWTWGGNLATHAFGSHGDPSVKFVAGIDHVAFSDTTGTRYWWRLVALNGGRESERIMVRSFAANFDDVRSHGDLGVPDLDDAISLSVPCLEGCGCTTGEVVVFWSGGRFHHVQDLMGSPDGDYSTNTRFIYPEDMEGEPGIIIRGTYDVIEADEDMEETSEEDEEHDLPYIQRLVRLEYLRWNGDQLVPQGLPTMERHYRMFTGPDR